MSHFEHGCLKHTGLVGSRVWERFCFRDTRWLQICVPGTLLGLASKAVRAHVWRVSG